MMKRILLLSAAFLLAVSANAKTVGWWRFEEAAAKAPITKNSVFKNEIDAAKFPAYAGVCAYGKNGKYSKDTLVYTPEKMPLATNAFPSTISLLNRQDAKCELANSGAVALNMHTINSANSPHAQIFIDDAEELRLQTFTLEFFARMPDTTKGWRCLATRCNSVYGTDKSAFHIYGGLYGSESGDLNGTIFLNALLNTVENPLYDDKGVITNLVNTRVTGRSLRFDNDRWRHVALVVDGDTKKMSLYVDYEFKESASYKGEIYYESGFPLAFGGDPQSMEFCSAFLLDEVRLSDVALKASEMLRYKQASAFSRNGAIDDDTLLYLPFEGSQETVTVGEGEMQNTFSYVPYLANHAFNPMFTGVSAQWKTRNVETDSYAVENDVPASMSRLGLRRGVAIDNLSSIHLKTNMPLEVDNGSTQTDLFSESCTVEFFFKAPPKGYSSTDKQIHIFSLYSAFEILVIETDPKVNWKGDGYVWATVGGVTLKTAGGTAGVNKLLNNKWHHCAIVYDKENSRADIYFDYVWRMGAVSVAVTPSRHKSYWNGLLIGGCYWKDRALGDFSFDEVRVSRGALRPYQFLTSKAVEEDLLARASFEDNLVMTPYTNFFGAAGTASAFVAGAAKPKCVRTRPARVLTAGPKGDIVTDSNRYSLEFNGGKVVYPSRTLLADTDEFTLEFFIKTDDARPGAGIMRVNRETSSAITNAVTWALSFADSNGNLHLKLDTDAEEGQTHEFAAALADDKWHHVGVQFARSDGNTEIKVYRDAELVGSWTANGRLLTRPRELNFMLGAGEDAAAGFVGLVDELRITPGIVPHTEFLTSRRKISTIVVR